MTAPAPGASPEERAVEIADGLWVDRCPHETIDVIEQWRCYGCVEAALLAALTAAPPSREEAIRRDERERIALDMEAHAAKLRKHTRPYDGGGWDMAADELEDFAEDIAPYPSRASAGEREGEG